MHICNPCGLYSLQLDAALDDEQIYSGQYPLISVKISPRLFMSNNKVINLFVVSGQVPLQE